MSDGQGYESDALTEFDDLAEEHQKELDALAKQFKAEKDERDAANAAEDEYWSNVESKLTESIVEQTTLNTQIDESNEALVVALDAVQIATGDEARARVEVSKLYRELSQLADMMKSDEQQITAGRDRLNELQAKIQSNMQSLKAVEQQKADAENKLGLLKTQLATLQTEVKKTKARGEAVSSLLERHKQAYRQQPVSVDELTLAISNMATDWSDKREKIKAALEMELAKACATPLPHSKHPFDTGSKGGTLDPAWHRRVQGWTFSSLRGSAP
jgi:chromosome segregation ATPase